MLELKKSQKKITYLVFILLIQVELIYQDNQKCSQIEITLDEFSSIKQICRQLEFHKLPLFLDHAQLVEPMSLL